MKQCLKTVETYFFRVRKLKNLERKKKYSGKHFSKKEGQAFL